MEEEEIPIFKSWRRVQGTSSLKFRTRSVDYVFVTHENEQVRGDENQQRALYNGRIWVDYMLQQALLHVYENEQLQPNDRVTITITGGDLTYPLTIPYHIYHSAEHQQRALTDAINRIQQSKKEWMMGVTLTLSIGIVQAYEGRGRKMKNNVITQERFEECQERCVVKRITDWSLMIHHALQRFGKKEVPDSPPLNAENWKEKMKTYCTLYPDINVLVLSQATWGGTHTILWKSECKETDRVIVLWQTPDGEWYEVMSPKWLFPGRVVLCLKCGHCFYSRRNHACCEEEFVGQKKYKRKAHFKCTENELKRKKRTRYDSMLDQNCLGASLFQMVKERKVETDHSLTLEQWFQKMQMKHTWNCPSDLKEVKEWAEKLQQIYQTPFELIVYDGSLKNFQARFGGENQPVSSPVFLEYDRRHFTWIRSMPGWMGVKNICNKCLKGFNHSPSTHKCNRECSQCGSPSTYHPRKEALFQCDDCGLRFGTQACFYFHKQNRDKKGEIFTQCQRKFKCYNCYSIVDLWDGKKLKKKSSHRCFQFNCNVCGQRNVTRNEHQCYIKTEAHHEDDFDVKKRTTKLAFFDFETRCLEEHHVVNKVVVLLVCNECQDYIEDWKTRGCTASCGRKRMWIFETVKEFMDWLLGPKMEKWMDYTFLAHNFKGYDAYPILEELVKRNISPSSCIYQGTKLLTMTVNGIVFKDSLCFIPMALRQFPAAFGTSGGKKGFFPHLFNKKENEQYIGPYPPLEDYGYDELTSEKDKQEMKTWWLSRQGETMNFQQELTEYCIQDVLVMMRGCWKYHELIVSLYGVSPFHEAVTLASTCMRVFTKNFLQPQTIGIVPPMGYRPRDVYSHQSME